MAVLGVVGREAGDIATDPVQLRMLASAENYLSAPQFLTVTKSSTGWVNAVGVKA
jgi:hypothetical protein